MRNEEKSDTPHQRDEQDLSARMKKFALRVVRLYCALPRTTEAQVSGKQLLRSGTSIGAHYREACRARSVAEFISKVEGGQELEETSYRLELPAEAEIVPEAGLTDSCREANELTSILFASAGTARQRH